MSKAGKNVRQMAFRRRIKAIQCGLISAALIAVPFVGPLLVPPTLGAIALPIWVYLFCFALAALNLLNARYLWKRAGHADQGAAGEEAIAQVLTPLERQGWTIEYGVRERSIGDVDVFLISPHGKAYTIDVKSHRGHVFSSKGQLYRKLGKSTLSFEKDFLSQAKKQAIAMKASKNLPFVTPIVAFSDASVKVGSNPVAGVYVVERQTLLSCLQVLG